MNQHYATAAKAVKSLGKAGASLWVSLVMFAMTQQEDRVEQPVKGTDMKPMFKAAETAASVEHKVKMGENSTYRVAKGVIVQAVSLGVALVDEKGKPRGKTDIEDELKGLKDEKPAIDKFKATMATATALAAKLDAKDTVMAAAMVSDLRKSLLESLKPEQLAA